MRAGRHGQAVGSDLAGVVAEPVQPPISQRSPVQPLTLIASPATYCQPAELARSPGRCLVWDKVGIAGGQRSRCRRLPALRGQAVRQFASSADLPAARRCSAHDDLACVGSTRRVMAVSLPCPWDKDRQVGVRHALQTVGSRRAGVVARARPAADLPAARRYSPLRLMASPATNCPTSAAAFVNSAFGVAPWPVCHQPGGRHRCKHVRCPRWVLHGARGSLPLWPYNTVCVKAQAAAPLQQ